MMSSQHLRHFFLYSKALALCLSLFVCCVQAQDLSKDSANLTYNSPTFGFSFSYSSVFEPVSLTTPGVLILLSHQSSNYPTFNVILLSGPPDLATSPSKRAERFINQYRAVGLDSSKLISSDLIELGDKKVQSFELQYPLQGEKMRSSLQWIPFNHYSLLLTYIDKEQNFKQNKHLHQAILDSFTVTDALSYSEDQPELRAALLYLLAIFLFILISGVLFWWVKCRNRL